MMPEHSYYSLFLRDRLAVNVLRALFRFTLHISKQVAQKSDATRIFLRNGLSSAILVTLC